MVLDEKAVAKIAKLARIAVTDAEKQHYAKEITGILLLIVPIWSSIVLKGVLDATFIAADA